MTTGVPGFRRPRLRLVVVAAIWLGVHACSGETMGDGPPDDGGTDSQQRHIAADTSYYISMRDGVRLALSLYFPGGLEPSEATTTILVMTRYGREWAYNLGEREDGYESFRRAGYVIAALDDRGSTASFGTRELELGPELVADMDEVISHIAKQDWSNQRVFTTGVSYMADAADISTGSSNTALVGAIVREADFDLFRHLFFPGGVANDLFIHGWGTWTSSIDAGRREQDGRLLDCVARKQDCLEFHPNVVPVSEDVDFALLQQAMADRVRWSPEAYDEAEFVDDRGANGFTIFESGPVRHIEAMRRRALPVQYWGGWIDGGTAASALDRFRSLPNVPMEVWITPNDHRNAQNADPFAMDQTTPFPTVTEQRALMRSFLERVQAGEPIRRSINYFVLGSGRYKTTDRWPPPGAVEHTYAFDVGGRLAAGRSATSGIDVYAVDYTATTGPDTRWSTQFGSPPHYRDRSDEDKKLLTYTSEPMPRDMELAGTPVVTLHMRSRTPDPAIYVYLENVSPDGRVTYLTEGVFRAIHRKVADPSTVPYDQGPVAHSFLRSDAVPMDSQQVAEVTFSLFPVAAKIGQGHRLRVAIAGADGDQFRRYSHGQEEEFQISRGGTAASRITIHIQPWLD